MGQASKRMVEAFGDTNLYYLYIHVIIDQFCLKLGLSTCDSYDLSLVYCKAQTIATILLFSGLSFGVKSYSQLLVN